jgi:2-methylisocitrate lyase-like PEP mutase family enzyme
VWVYARQQVITLEEQLNRLRAARDAKKNRDFFIVARADAVFVEA